MFLDKLESGVLAFKTNDGSFYVRPTGWQRVQLLWTFRHFQSLSPKLLNTRQLRLVEGLYRTSANSLHIAAGDACVIGTVEASQFPALSQLTLASAKHEVVLPLPVPQKEDRRKEDKIAKRYTPEKATASKARRRVFGSIDWSRMGFVFGAGALCVLGIVFLPLQSRAPQVRAHATSTAAVEPTPASYEVQPTIVFPGSENQASANIQPATASEVVTPLPPQSLSSPTSSPVATPASQAVEIRRANSPSAPGPSDRIAAKLNPPQPLDESALIQFSRPPRRVLYPDYPATTAKGEVYLKAVLTPDGAVRETKVLSGNKLLAAAALRAVRQWHYAPYYKDGQSVETETNISISFISPDAISISFPAAGAIR